MTIELEHSKASSLLATALLASATGARSMSGVAALARARVALDGSSGNARLSQVVGAMAAMEFVGDTLPGIPDRIDALPLLGRVASGAIIGATVGGMTGRNRTLGAAIGGLMALIAAEATFRLRAELSRHMPAGLAAVVEDTLVLAAATAGATLLQRKPAARPDFPLER